MPIINGVSTDIAIDSQFVINHQGKRFVLYAGLLHYGHELGLRKLKVIIDQYPTKENDNTTICRAIAFGVRDGIEYEFEEYGDANSGNVGSMVAKHSRRMAATRAKARALRDFTDIGMTAREELGDGDGDAEEYVAPPPKPKKDLGSPQERIENAVTKLATLGISVKTLPDPENANFDERITQLGKHFVSMKAKIAKDQKLTEAELNV